MLVADSRALQWVSRHPNNSSITPWILPHGIRTDVTVQPSREARPWPRAHGQRKESSSAPRQLRNTTEKCNTAFVLYGCQTWSLTLREGHNLRVFENRVLRRIFGPARDEVTGERRRLHNKELYVSYCSPNINQVIKSRHVARTGHIQSFGEETWGKETTWKTQAQMGG
jgi:hypothetical protein